MFVEMLPDAELREYLVRQSLDFPWPRSRYKSKYASNRAVNHMFTPYFRPENQGMLFDRVIETEAKLLRR